MSNSTSNPQTFFGSAAESFCDDTSATHCILDTFLISPIAILFVLMTPFLFLWSTHGADAAAGFSWRFFRRRSMRIIRISQACICVPLTVLPLLMTILQAMSIIDVEHTHTGNWVYAISSSGAWLTTLIVLVQRYRAHEEIPDFFQMWWIWNWIVELATTVILFKIAHPEKEGLNSLDVISIIQLSLLTILVAPSIFEAGSTCMRDTRFARKRGGFRAVLTYFMLCGYWDDANIDDEAHMEKLTSPMARTHENENISLLENERGYTSVEVSKRQASPEQKAGILSRAFFTWISHLMGLGFQRPLVFEDLPNLSPSDDSQRIASLFEDAWTRQKEIAVKKNTQSPLGASAPAQPSLVRALASAFGPLMYGAALFKFVYDLLTFTGPALLDAIVSYLDNVTAGIEHRAWVGYAYALLLFFSSVIQTILLHQYFFRVFRAGQQLRSSVIVSVYRKALKLSMQARQQKTVGEIVNIMSTDAQRMQDLTTYLQMIWSAPLQIVLATYFLWQQIGPSVFAGIAVMVMFIPINGWLARVSKKLQEKLMGIKDKRVNLTNEVLNGIKLIKLSAWEIRFRQFINEIRDEELRKLWKYTILQRVVTVLWVGLPLLVSLTSFGMYAALGNELTPARAFTSLSLFNILRFPLSMLPNVVNNVVEASVSFRRIREFLCSENIDDSATHRLPKRFGNHGTSVLQTVPKSMRKFSVGIHNGCYTWQAETALSNVSKDSVGNLRDVTMGAQEGQLVTLVGGVGAGKTSLLLALLGEMHRLEGTAWICGSVAYVSQSAFILNATVRDNILFGKRFDEDLYRKAVDVCQLRSDLAILPGGDQTEIGERGVNLSGGQKQRISLARAVYADADVYLFDDPLSAVDSHVGQSIFERCIQGALRHKTRILVTHGLQYVAASDYVYIIDNGRIAESGIYKDLVQNRGENALLASLVARFDKEANEVFANATAEAANAQRDSTGRDRSASAGSIEHDGLSRSRTQSIQSTSNVSWRSDSTTEPPIVVSNEGAGKLVETEAMSRGTVDRRVYGAYARAVGGIPAVVLLMFSYACYASGGVIVNWWLSEWSAGVDTSNGHVPSHSSMYYYVIYCALSVIAIMVLVAAQFLVATFGIRASRKLHERLIKIILHARQSFFDTTPVGRILNRFSQDIYTIDEVLPRTFSSFLSQFFTVLSTMLLICVVTPWFTVILIPLAMLYLYIQRYYVTTSRELRRLDSVSKSPIFGHFGQTLSGFVTIRAYQDAQRFIQTNDTLLNANQQAYFSSTTANRWLAVRLELIGSVIVASAAIFAVAGRGSVGASLAGLSISYALSITQSLNWLVRMAGQAETLIVAVERVGEYSAVETECDPDETEESIKERAQKAGATTDWPTRGQISIRNMNVKYRFSTPYVLKNINADIVGGEKIGICGRTGAGKSSLISTIFRTADVQEGTIFVDGVNLANVPLQVLRSKFSIIPQDPVLFSGSLRRNLDPLQIYSDMQLWRALEQVGLSDLVKQTPLGLETPVSEGGENWSSGQRQLICMARALARSAKVVVLDEATASVDVESDSLLQKAIRQQFTQSTVLTIAHRVHTILDSDRIMVLDSGNILEFDKPGSLLAHKNSAFKSLMKQSQAASQEASLSSHK